MLRQTAIATLILFTAGAWGDDAPAPAVVLSHLTDATGKSLGSLDDWLRENHVPGVSIAVIEDFQIAWTWTAGKADAESGRKVDTDTLFQAASISKAVSAAASHILAEQGKLSLDQPVNEQLKSWQVPAYDFPGAPPVTPRLLLSHRAGTNAHGFDGYPADAPLPTVVQILNGESPAISPAIIVEHAPGEAFQYSGGGITIMQLLLGDITGNAPGDVVQELVLQHAGMTRSFYSQPLDPALTGNAALAHYGRGRVLPGGFHVYPELFAAGLWTTPTDLAHYAIAIQNALRGAESPFSKAVAEGLTTPVGGGPTSPGFFVDKNWFGHGGSNHGYRCELKAHLRDGCGMAVMTNADRGGKLLSILFTTLSNAYGWE